MPEFSVKHTDRSRYMITIPFKRSAKWEQWVLLRSDAHHDNPHSRHDLEKKHLDLALERDAIVADGGDMFCAMQGRGDPRGHKSAVRPEHNHDRYLDSLIETAHEFYAPYAKNWAIQATGNHESSVLLRKETDLIQRWVGLMNASGGSIASVGMMSHILWRFQEERKNTVAASYIARMHVHHGYGGGGPVTKDILQTNRKAVYLADSDIVWSGHTHDSWVFPIKRETTTRNGLARFHHQWHVKTPTYKDEYNSGGWATSKGMPPKPLGCVWLRFYWIYDNKGQGKDNKRSDKSRLAWEFIADIE